MAHAIDEIRSDDRATNGIGDAGAIASWSGGCRAPRAGDPVARRWGYLHDDHGQDGLQLADDRVVEAAVRDRWCRGAHRSAPWFEYYRHGTLSLYAALNTHTGEVLGNAVPRHTSDEFVAFLTAVVATQPRRRAIHIIVDNLSAHKTQKVRTFLAAHPAVRLHY